MDTETQGFMASSVRPGHPDFLDLPWGCSLSDWVGRCERLERLPVGPSRHLVVVVSYDGVLYALKELPPGVAEREYDLLRRMGDLRLPVVMPVGHLRVRSSAGEASVLVTRYLDRSLPYFLLFQQGSLQRNRDNLLDAMTSLLVQLHLAGVYWGDCSMYNTLFRRDAGALQAYLVDAETSEIHPQLPAGLRASDVDIMEENVVGALLDLQAAGLLPEGFGVTETGAYLRQRYAELWAEIDRVEEVDAGERFRIQERVRKLNALGFSVDEVEIGAAEGGHRLRLRAIVTDRHFHRNVLQTLTGLDTEENQALRIVNEIQELRATLCAERNRSLPLSVAAFHWQEQVFLPVLERLRPRLAPDADPVEAYCEVLEHKWYLSERAQVDVGHVAAVEDYLGREPAGEPAAGTDPET